MRTTKLVTAALLSMAVASCGGGDGHAAAANVTRPTVISTNPAGYFGSVVLIADIEVNSAITATFSEVMMASTINPATFTLSDGTSYISGAVTYTGTTATFSPTGNLAYGTMYTATLTTAVKDEAGNSIAAPFSNSIAAPYSWSFVTRPAPGGLDTTFGFTCKVTTAIGAGNDAASAVAIQSDGKIVAAGYSYNGTDNDFALVRYNTDGSLDTSFNTNGEVTTAIGTGNDVASAVAIQSDGKIVVAGYSYNGTDNDFALVRYNTDGSLDTTFNATGKVTTAIGAGNDVAYAVAIQSDGKIVGAGYSYNGSDNDFALVRYNTDGSLDTTFNSTGEVTTAIGTGNDVAYAVAIQSDGKIVAAGSSSFTDFALVRYNTDGSLDTTFNSTGKVATTISLSFSGASAVAIQSDGRIVAAGYSYNFSGGSDFALVRYSTDGALDTSFNTTGKVTTSFSLINDKANAIVIQSDGKIIAAGYTDNGNAYNYTGSDFALARYTTDGSLDTSFNTTGKVTTSFESNFVGPGTSVYASAVAIQSDGKIVAAGYSYNGTENDFALVRYWP